MQHVGWELSWCKLFIPHTTPFKFDLSCFRKTFGAAETPSIEENIPTDEDDDDTAADDDTDINRNGSVHQHTSVIVNQKKPYEALISWLKQCPKHALCRHKYGCVFYVLEVSRSN